MENTKSLAELGIEASFRRADRPLKIGIVGLGGISAAHQGAYREAGWTVTLGADISAERRAWAEREHGLARTTDRWESVVEDPEVEVVSVLTQPTLRVPIVEACAALGKPVLVEKPMASSLEDAATMITAAEAAGIATTVSQNYRWLSAQFVAKRLIEQGRIGKPFFVSIEIHGRQDRDLADHPFYPHSDDFLTVQWNTHLADLIRHFIGRDGTRLFTRTRRAPDQNFASDNLLVSIHELGDGATGHIFHSELCLSSMTNERFRIEGSEGTIEGGIWQPWLTLDTAPTGRVEVDVTGLPHSFSGPMGELMFAAERGEEPLLSFRRNLPTLETVYAEQRSALAGGVWIDLRA